MCSYCNKVVNTNLKEINKSYIEGTICESDCMGYLIILIVVPVILLILGLIFLSKPNQVTLILLIIFIIPIIGVSSGFWNDTKFIEFDKKYVYVTSINPSDIKNVEWKIDYWNDVRWINKEIEYAKKNHDSFWYGAFTDKRLLNYKEIQIN